MKRNSAILCSPIIKHNEARRSEESQSTQVFSAHQKESKLKNPQNPQILE